MNLSKALTKPLAKLSHDEWESLCDGCGLCCLHKLEFDEEPGLIHTTCVSCQLLDSESGRCRDYAERFKTVPNCTQLSLDNLAEIDWLPDSCAYRCRFEGRDLPEWHPLLTGQPIPVTIGVKAMAIVSEQEVELEEDLEDYIVEL